VTSRRDTRRFADIFSLDAPEESAAGKSSNQLLVPTIDERATLYLRATKGRDDFTNKERSDARTLILDAMAADIIARSKASLPEGLTRRNSFGDAEPGGIAPTANLDDPLTAQLAICCDFSPCEFSPRPFLETVYEYRPSVHRAPPSPLFEGPEVYAGSIPASDVRGLRRIMRSSTRTRTVRTIYIGAAAGIAALGALFLVTAVPMSWFSTNQNLIESRVVAVQPPPPESFEIETKIAGPKQVETTVAPLGSSTLQRFAPTNQIGTEEIAELLKRGRELITTGDFFAARLVLKQAAEAGNAFAALELGATYDPILLAEHFSITIEPNLEMARTWYEKAKELGSAEASERLKKLAAPPPSTR
jgi:hypothetical protein